MPHILVRDFTEKQKSVVENAARACVPKMSTSRYVRDAAIEKAGGKVEEDAPAKSAPKAPAAPKAAVRKVAAKRPAKKVAAPKAKAPAKPKGIFDRIPTRKPADLTQPQFRNKAKGKL